jgi:hypothetical protein
MTQENLLLQLEDYLYDLKLKGEDLPKIDQAVFGGMG